jgi:hypothetical protein
MEQLYQCTLISTALHQVYNLNLLYTTILFHCLPKMSVAIQLVSHCFNYCNKNSDFILSH